MRSLASWPLSRVLGVAAAWTIVTLLIAFATPPGRFLIWLYGALRANQQVDANVPVAALRVWFALVPILTFGPPAVALIVWLRARGVGRGDGTR